MFTSVNEPATLIRIENLIHTLVHRGYRDEKLVIELVQIIEAFRFCYRREYYYSPLIRDFIKVWTLINVLCTEMQSSNLYFWGSSMGGYGAIVHGFELNATAVYAHIPQTKLKHSRSYWPV